MLTISQTEVQEDRFSRLRLIPWWDQQKIAACRVLVVGAGALGNEVLKNLALLGFRKVVVVDLDHIEESNLSRTVLYRKEDIGRVKAEVAAAAYKAIAPGATVQPLNANILYGCGLGLFEWSDLIIAGLDNREARLWINRSAWKVNRPWIDGAIEGINGVARVFLPGTPPCYECTLGEVDWAILERRMSCNLLAHRQDTEGKVPTTPTISSIIAGIQVQEAVKLIHGLPTLASRGFIFEGLNHSSYTVDYTENEACMSHYTLPAIARLAETSHDLTIHDLWLRAKKDFATSAPSNPAGAAPAGAPFKPDFGLSGSTTEAPSDAAQSHVLEFSRDVIHRLVCPKCGSTEELFAPVGSVRYDDGPCPRDGHMRIVDQLHSYSGTESFGSRKLSELGLPPFDIYVARSADREIAYLLAGDAPAVLGPLAEEGSAQ